MPLVNARNACAGPADMIEYRFDHLEAGTEPLETGGDRSPQVMEAPCRNGVTTVSRE
jgi:hypothetical protein